MPLRVRISHLADSDLEDVFVEGHRLFGGVQAERYFFELFDVFQLLADHPRMGRQADEGYRVHVHRSHVILYRLIDTTEVEIARVIHVRQDWRQLLRQQ